MTKPHRRKIVLPAQPIGRNATLYTQPASATLVAGVLFVVFVAFGIGMLFQKVYFPVVFAFSIAWALAYNKFTEVQKLYISEDTMFVKYLMSTKVYKAHEIESVEWKSVAVMRHHQYEFRPILVIRTKSKKKIEIPPPGRYDIQKSILKWCEKYQTPSETNVIISE